MANNSWVESFYFATDDEVTQDLPDDLVQIDVKANSINAPDLGAATGRKPGLILGIDAAGVVSRVGSAVSALAVGDRIALAGQNTWRTDLRVHENTPQKIPAHISLEQAATIPFVYTTAYQGVKQLARLEKG